MFVSISSSAAYEGNSLNTDAYASHVQDKAEIHTSVHLS